MDKCTPGTVLRNRRAAAHRGTHRRETMLSVSGKIILSENMSIEFANSNPSYTCYTSTVCLCCYCDIRIEVFTTTW